MKKIINIEIKLIGMFLSIGYTTFMGFCFNEEDLSWAIPMLIIMNILVFILLFCGNKNDEYWRNQH